MTKIIYQLFYGLPLYRVIVYMMIIIIFWILLAYRIEEKFNKPFFWKLVNIVVAVSSFVIIGGVTLTNRVSTVENFILIPFRSFIEARIQPELYRSMLMNVFLFFPLGLTLPYALPEKWNKKVLLSILFAMVLSIGIEFAQYHFHLGRAETDDVICNTLGCAIGTISYLLANRKNKASV